MKSRLLILALVASLAFPMAACTNMNKTQQGTLSGAAVGALGGAGISALAGGSGTIGAAIGAVAGGIGGALYGHNK